MADGFALLEHRLVRLIVAAAVDRALEPADVEVMLREIEVLLVVRRAVELQAIRRVALAAREGRTTRLLTRRRPPGERC